MENIISENERVFIASEAKAIEMSVYATHPETKIKYDLDFVYKETNSNGYDYHVIYKDHKNVLKQICEKNGLELDAIGKAKLILRELIGGCLGTLTPDEPKTFMLMCR